MDPRHVRHCIAAACAALSVSSWAQQTPPDAGAALRENTPTAPVLPRPDAARLPAPPAAPTVEATAAGPTFVLKAVTFTGATVFSPAELQALAAGKIGQNVTLADLEALAAAVTRKYRDSGYVVAQAVVPAQDVTLGNVSISILEGRLGKVQIEKDGDIRVPDSLISGVVRGVPVGQPLRIDTLERAMLLLSDLPGLLVAGELEPGSADGNTDLIIRLKAKSKVDVALDADNYGSRSTGEYRAGVIARFNSPFGLGDNIDVRYSQALNGDLLYGRASYELPVGDNGTRLALGIGRVKYELGREFAPLDANGTASVLDVNLLHPFIRNRKNTLIGRLSVETRRLSDRQDAFGLRTDKRLDEVAATLSYESRDGLAGGGFTNATVSLRHSRLGFDDAAGLAADQGIAGRHTAGSALRLAFQASRLQSVAPNTFVFAGLVGQVANKNLDSAARFALGGPSAVRGYTPSEGVVDEGAVLQLEARYALSPELTGFVFLDSGWGRFDADGSPPGQPENIVRRSAGVGANWVLPAGFQMRASLAWRGKQLPLATGDDRRPRLYMQVVKNF